MCMVRAHVTCACGEARAMRARDTPATRAPPARQHSPPSHALCHPHPLLHTWLLHTLAKPRVAPLSASEARLSAAATPSAPCDCVCTSETRP